MTDQSLHHGQVRTHEYNYTLPDEKIARFPIEKRDEAKLLVYKNASINHSQFKHIPSFLPTDSVLVYNNTKVIAARCVFKKTTGSQIEILLLEPFEKDIVQTLSSTRNCIWNCEIGNLKRWNQTVVLQNQGVCAKLIDREKKIVEFKWESGEAFSEVLERIGAVPIPPYLKREATHSDKITYQTIYAKQEGAIAAPTAGLHFTQAVFDQLDSLGIKRTEVTLHVGAGTFKPLKSEFAHQHDMHSEKIAVPLSTIELLGQKNDIVCVGTTSIRTLESLYWFAVKLHFEQDKSFAIDKLFPYRFEGLPLTRKQALEILIQFCTENKIEVLTGQTSLMIIPDYRFAFCDALITNFHQPESSLMLLVGAFCKDWKAVYEQALQNDYRFLSYGDSSLLFYEADHQVINC